MPSSHDDGEVEDQGVHRQQGGEPGDPARRAAGLRARVARRRSASSGRPLGPWCAHVVTHLHPAAAAGGRARAAATGQRGTPQVGRLPRRKTRLRHKGERPSSRPAPVPSSTGLHRGRTASRPVLRPRHAGPRSEPEQRKLTVCSVGCDKPLNQAVVACAADSVGARQTTGPPLSGGHADTGSA